MIFLCLHHLPNQHLWANELKIYLFFLVEKPNIGSTLEIAKNGLCCFQVFFASLYVHN